MSHKVFVSHAEEDASTALFFCTALEKSGVPCWIAPRNLQPGLSFAEAIVAAVESSKVLLVLLSAGANASPYVEREVGLAVDGGISILPIRIDAVQPARGLKLYLQGLQRFDAFPKPLEDHLPAVIAAAKSLAHEGKVSEEDQPSDPEPVGNRSARPVDEAEQDAALVAQSAVAKRGLPLSPISNLLIFSTLKQKTWLSFTLAGVVCVLDNRAKGGGVRAQWFEPLANIDPSTVSAQDRQGRPGLLRIGTHKNWLYTKALFGSGDHLKEKILAEVERARK